MEKQSIGNYEYKKQVLHALLYLHQLLPLIEEVRKLKEIVFAKYEHTISSGFTLNTESEYFSMISNYLTELETEKDEIIRFTNPYCKSYRGSNRIHDDIQEGFSFQHEPPTKSEQEIYWPE